MYIKKVFSLFIFLYLFLSGITNNELEAATSRVLLKCVPFHFVATAAGKGQELDDHKSKSLYFIVTNSFVYSTEVCEQRFLFTTFFIDLRKRYFHCHDPRGPPVV